MTSAQDTKQNLEESGILKKMGLQLLSLFFFLLIVWGFAVLCMFFLQRSLLYFPDKTSIGDPSHTGVANMRSIPLPTRDGLVLNSWYVPPKSKQHPVVVVYHGNAGNIRGRAWRADFFQEYGIGTLLVEYRGYGGNKGKPTEGGLYTDGRAAIDFLVKKQKISEKRLVLYGESIGSGIATQMATEYTEGAVILESPFRSLVDVAKKHYPWVPVDVLIWDKYENRKKIAYVDSPVMILHGTADTVVPYSEGQYLYEAAQEPKNMVSVVDAQHHDLYEHTQTGRSVIAFLKQHKLLPASP